MPFPHQQRRNLSLQAVPSPCFLAVRNGLSHQLPKTLHVLKNTSPRSELQLLLNQPRLEHEPPLCHHHQQSDFFFKNHLTYLTLVRYLSALFINYVIFLTPFCTEVCSSSGSKQKLMLYIILHFIQPSPKYLEK